MVTLKYTAPAVVAARMAERLALLQQAEQAKRELDIIFGTWVHTQQLENPDEVHLLGVEGTTVTIMRVARIKADDGSQD